MIQITADAVANLTNGKLTGDRSKIITGIKGIEEAEKEDMTFLSDIKYIKYLNDTNAGVILVNKDFQIDQNIDKTFIYVDNAYQAVVTLLNFINEKINQPGSGIHPKAVVDETAVIGDNVLLSPGCVIGKNVKISNHVKIMPNAVVYDNVQIDEDTIIHANSVIAKDTIIGKRCLIQAGAVIGSEGFGFIEHKDGSYTRIPQLGKVIIEDDVEIGANTTIDRAMVGRTLIQKGVKLDNLIQIGHNCNIGENTAMAAQVGVSGSVKIGKRNRFGGRVGLAGHIDTTDDVILMAQSGVAKTIENSGVYFGSPIKDKLLAFKIEAGLRQLPDALKELSRIKRKLSNNE